MGDLYCEDAYYVMGGYAHLIHRMNIYSLKKARPESREIRECFACGCDVLYKYIFDN
jgi:hypothetical protein